MEKIANIFGFGASGADFNPFLLFPVVIVVCAAVAVFLFGFKKSDTPKFRRINENSTSGKSANNSISSSLKRKKRKNISPELALTIVTSSDRSSSEPTQAKSKSRDLRSVGAAITAKKESPEKKLNVSAKVTITTKAAAKNLKNQKLTPASRPTEIIGLNNEEGEWQTVLKKKPKPQKKEHVTDLLIQAVAEASSKTKKNKGASAERVINVAETTAIAASKKNNNKKHEKSSIHREENLQHPHEKTAEFTLDAIAVKPNLEYNNSVINEAIVPDVVSSNNLVFDELADAAWTENKPQRRNRRALRE